RRAIERSARVIVGIHEQVVCGAAIIHRNLDGVAAIIRTVAGPHRENLPDNRVQSRQIDTLVFTESAERSAGQEGLVDLASAVNSRRPGRPLIADWSLNSWITLDSRRPLVSRKTCKTRISRRPH